MVGCEEPYIGEESISRPPASKKAAITAAHSSRSARIVADIEGDPAAQTDDRQRFAGRGDGSGQRRILLCRHRERQPGRCRQEHVLQYSSPGRHHLRLHHSTCRRLPITVRKTAIGHAGFPPSAGIVLHAGQKRHAASRIASRLGKSKPRAPGARACYPLCRTCGIVCNAICWLVAGRRHVKGNCTMRFIVRHLILLLAFAGPAHAGGEWRGGDDPFVDDEPAFYAKGCYWRAGIRHCSQYCYLEINGKRIAMSARGWPCRRVTPTLRSARQWKRFTAVAAHIPTLKRGNQVSLQRRAQSPKSPTRFAS